MEHDPPFMLWRGVGGGNGGGPTLAGVQNEHSGTWSFTVRLPCLEGSTRSGLEHIISRNDLFYGTTQSHHSSLKHKVSLFQFTTEIHVKV